jgi:hypothetical protein
MHSFLSGVYLRVKLPLHSVVHYVVLSKFSEVVAPAAQPLG